MWLVLCERRDLAALWAYRGLSRRGFDPLELVSADVLACALHWEHRLGADGVRTELTVAGGRTIRSEEVRGVLNRLVAIPDDHLRGAPAAERAYATQELFAFFVSWLNGLGSRVLNRPVPQGLSGPWLRLSEWLALAARAGLSTPPYRRTSRQSPAFGYEPPPVAGRLRTVLVVDGGVVGERVPSSVEAGCVRLSELAGTAILGVDFGRNGDERWAFAGATPLPELRGGGERALDLIAAALRERAA